ncbi:aldehyde dehydrogenase [Obba rivulosa]|uniref:Aldehyde dehydrogenase n=1 Tax=Obba rivulosa TaxID=1052685 RepID=A0A8E2AVV7_9APHY|nr:aldehyde dehydrogenase [Obba rivulosa]
MPEIFEYEWNTPAYKGKTALPTGLYIDGKWVEGSSQSTIDVINPTNGKVITKIAEGTAKDVDLAVQAAHKAFETTWGLNAPGSERGRLLYKLADLIEQHTEEFAAIEALDNGKAFNWAKMADVGLSLGIWRYYAGWADKVQGDTIETSADKLNYTRHEPIGACGLIVPWNFPLLIASWKIAPALATGCTVILKPSEFTPLTALLLAKLTAEAGFPAGVFNVVNGYGHVVGQALSEHPTLEKIGFTGSTLVGRKLMEASAKSNLKKLSLELGGKSPNIIFDDADLDAAVQWANHGIFFNHGQVCAAGSRIFVHAKIYDEFLKKFTEKTKELKVGDPFAPDTFQGPQVSEVQFNRVMGYIEAGKAAGATLHLGGHRIGNEGYFIAPTIFTDTTPDMQIVREEIFGPVAAIIKFEDDDDIVAKANDSVYGLAAAVFSKDIKRALTTAHKLRAGTVWVNCYNNLAPNVPFGGFKQSGFGRDLGAHALENYTSVKAVQVNLA